VTQTVDRQADAEETTLSITEPTEAASDEYLDNDNEDDDDDDELVSMPSGGRPADRRLENVLDEWKLKYQQKDVLIAKIARGESAQVRMSVHRAPQERVEEYEVQLNNGAVFPPIVVRKNTYELIDGNTRLEAHKRAGRTTISAYLVDVSSYEICRDLGVFQNQQNGERLTQSEQFTWARSALGRKLHPEIIARISALSVETVRRIAYEQEFEAKALKAGLDVTSLTLPKAARAAIGHELAQLSQVKAVTEVVEESGMSSPETKKLIRLVKEAPSEEASLQIVADAREARLPQIQQRAAGVKQPRPTFAQQSFSHMQWLLDHSLDEMIEFRPELAAKQAGMARELCTHICGLATKVEAYVASLPTEAASDQPQDSAT
jgi:ParB-like chromosome segregation protein Spo0J